MLVTAGVLAHLPMFLMGRMTHYHLYGMPIGNDMIAGMGAIVLGVAIAAYGLLPRNIARQLAASQDIVVSPPEDAPLSRAHWMLMSVLVIAFVAMIFTPSDPYSMMLMMLPLVGLYFFGIMLCKWMPRRASAETISFDPPTLLRWSVPFVPVAC